MSSCIWPKFFFWTELNCSWISSKIRIHFRDLKTEQISKCLWRTGQSVFDEYFFPVGLHYLVRYGLNLKDIHPTYGMDHAHVDIILYVLIIYFAKQGLTFDRTQVEWELFPENEGGFIKSVLRCTHAVYHKSKSTI